MGGLDRSDCQFLVAMAKPAAGRGLSQSKESSLLLDASCQAKEPSSSDLLTYSRVALQGLVIPAPKHLQEVEANGSPHNLLLLLLVSLQVAPVDVQAWVEAGGVQVLADILSTEASSSNISTSSSSLCIQVIWLLRKLVSNDGSLPNVLVDAGYLPLLLQQLTEQEELNMGVCQLLVAVCEAGGVAVVRKFRLAGGVGRLLEHCQW